MRAGRLCDLGFKAQVTSWLEVPLLRLREEQACGKMQSSALDIPGSVGLEWRQVRGLEPGKSGQMLPKEHSLDDFEESQVPPEQSSGLNH